MVHLLKICRSIIVVLFLSFLMGSQILAASGNSSKSSSDQAPVPTGPQKAQPIDRKQVNGVIPSANGSSQSSDGSVDAAAYLTPEQTAEAREAAFQGILTQAFPLSPNEIRRLHSKYQETQRAMESPIGIPPKPVSSTKIVSLSPGSVPPVVRLSQGFVSSLVFVDATGAPWPIMAYDNGNPKAFNVQWNKEDNILMIQAKVPFTYANMAIKLKDLPTPIMLTLVPGQKIVDYRADLRIQKFGPNAKPLPMDSGMPGTADPTLLGILDGVPPPGSEYMKVTGGEAQAWVTGQKLYLRTYLTVLSPSWLSTMSSSDGINAYLLPFAPTILVSDHGRPKPIHIEAFDNGS